MSFLEEIKKKKQALSHTKTLSRTVDGRVFLEDIQEGSQEYKCSTYGFVVDMKPELSVAQVLPGLLMGSQDVAHSQQLLLEHNVTHILSLGVQVPQYPGFFYTYIGALDLPEFSLLDLFPKCFKIIDHVRKNGNTIYVHCNAGVSRSASVVIAYLMKEYGMNYQTSLEFLKTIRPCIQPNDGFKKQLLIYQESLSKEK